MPFVDLLIEAGGRRDDYGNAEILTSPAASPLPITICS